MRADPEAADATPRFDIGRVEVRGRRRGPLSSGLLLTSIDALHRDVIAEQSTQTTWELFSLVPGVLLTNYNQGTTSGKVAFRGFNGEGEVNAVKLLIDGVPSNSNNGNMPYLDGVFPLELESVEVVRGTNDARHGLHNIGGNIHLTTRQGGNDTLVRLGAGSFGSHDVQVAKGVEQGGVSLNLFAGFKHTDGWRQHSASDRKVLSGRWSVQDGGWAVGMTARYFEHEAQEPGYLTQADAQADPEQSYAYVSTDGGRRKTGQLALHLENQVTPELTATGRLYYNRYRDDRWVRFSAAVSQQERWTSEDHTGAQVGWSWRPRVGGLHAFALEGGLDIESQDNQSQRYTTVERVRGTQTRDQSYTLQTTGAHLQAVIQPTAAFKLVPGFRVDQVSGRFTNGLTGETADVNDYGTIRQPKLSAVWTLRPEASLYANWGRTFQIGTEAAAYKVPPRTADLKPSINEGWELGVKFAPLPWLDGRLAGWQQTATDEVRRRLNDPSGDSDNIGATRRRGVDLQLGLHPSSTVDAWVAVTLQKAVIVTPDPAAPATQGKEIDHVPHRILHAGLDWSPLARWKFTAAVQGQSDYYLERTNTTGQFGACTVLNLGAAWQVTPRVKLEAQLRNATDRSAEYVWHDGTQSLHSPGAPRSLSLALSASL
ncbi:TonB-dependent receptor [Sphaerotilus hippei]|nr:TonB-dependent receptor [Sphaerotilus hippei]